MIGISWGGFNGLQTAARQAPALKAVITLCATVDRYSDDMHYMGGSLLTDDMDWGGSFYSVAGLPLDPAMVGAGWKEQWLSRLDVLEPFPAKWLQHQRRDDFWEHGSVCEVYSKLNCPILAVSGWADGYTGVVFRLVEALNRPDVKGIVGPWGHLYPHRGVPGPAIGFLQECVRWWDRWLKNKQNKVEDEPALRLWLQEYAPPKGHYDMRPGRWIALDGWPTNKTDRTLWRLNSVGLTRSADAETVIAIKSPQTTGLAQGEWTAYALCKVAPELPLDQRRDDAGSLTFDTPVFEEPATLIGSPLLELDLSVDQPFALVSVRLSDVAPDGAVRRVTYGLLNLTHRESHSSPAKLEPGRRYEVKLRLNEAAHVFGPGHKVRVSISTVSFPMTWPSPKEATLSVYTGKSTIELPFAMDRSFSEAAPFEVAEYARPRPVTVIRPEADTIEILPGFAGGSKGRASSAP